MIGSAVLMGVLAMNLFIRSYAIFFCLAMPVSLVACSGNPGVPSEDLTQPEIKKSKHLYLDEGEISATLQGSDLFVSLVLHRTGDDAIGGDAIVSVDALDGSYHREVETTFKIEAEAETLIFMLADAFEDADDPAVQAAHVIRYRFVDGDDQLMGRRSLFVAMPKAQLLVLGPRTFYQGELTRVKVFARDAVTGKPFAKQTINLVTTVGDEVSEMKLTTDEFGAAAADLRFEDAGDAAITATMMSQGGTSIQAEQPVDVIRMLKVLVTTDKPIYQPGQEMHLRVLALRKPLLAPEVDEESVIEVFDGKGNKVFKEKVRTSEFGIAFARFQLAHEVNMGTYKVKATVGETVTEKAVTVDRYTLPKFRVDVSLDKAFYVVGDTLKGTLSARYFFGKAVDGGSARITLATFDVEFTDFAEVTGTTSDEGLFEFEVALPTFLVGQDLEQGQAIVRLTAQVLDTAGQSVDKEQGITVAQNSFNIVIIPESGNIVPGIENRFYVFTEDPAGNPISLQVHVGADTQTWAVDTDETGLGWFIHQPEQPTLAIETTAEDAQGNQVDRTFEFKAGVSGEAILVRADKAIYKVGDTAEVTVFAPDAKDRVYMDVIRQQQIVREEAFDLVGGQATFLVDLDQEMAGDLVYSAYYLGRTGQIVRDEKLVFVQGADSLTIEITPDKGPYLPGEEAKINFQVTGANGAPAVAALGLQVVDEAVYALSENKPGLLRTYFELEEAIQEPKFEIHDAHFDLSDIVTTNPEDEEGEAVLEIKAQAAFAALGNPGATEVASSWDQALQDAAAVLKPHYDKDLERVLLALQEKLYDGDLIENEIAQYLVSQTEFYDFFGNLYVFGSAGSDYLISMRSLGPDEMDGTDDDWKTTFETWQAWGNWGWGDDQMAMDGNGGPMAGGNPGPPEANQKNETSGGGEPKIRKDFPETLYINPELITNESGEAVAQIGMADSITEWRLSSIANAVDGRLGSATQGITVFMDFFVDVEVPRVMTRGDQIHFPLAVYNYLDVPQMVQLEVELGDWADLLSPAQASVTLEPGEVKGLSVGILAKDVGWHGVTVKAYGDQGLSDAVMRLIEVDPDGVEVRDSQAGKLAGTVSRTVSFPMDAIPGTEKITVKVYPGVMAQAIEGLDSLLQMPSGCFEQTTATLWPNALVLDYMTQSGKITPEIELKAREFVNLGYQRLLTFECTGGGFTWFGDPNPANIILSAMGVMEFTDIGKVHEIDEAIVPRTLDFLATQQADDGHWHEDQGSEFATVRYDDLMTTCFVVWGMAQAGEQGGAAGKGFDYVTSHIGDLTSTYATALCANGLAAYNQGSSVTQKVLNDLIAAVKEDGDYVYWEAGVEDGQSYYGGGDGTNIEATALALLALLEAGQAPDLVGKAIGWMASKKDSFGNWGSTHATILSLKAFVNSLTALVQEADGVVQVGINGGEEAPVIITNENLDVFYQFELADQVIPGEQNQVSASFEGEGTLMYQIVWSHYEPGQAPDNPMAPLSIEVFYDKTHLSVDEVIDVTAHVTNISFESAPMVLVDLGIPPGFDLMTGDLEQAVTDQLIQKFEITAKQILVYVEDILPEETLVLSYQLKAKYPLKVQAPDSSASLYYDADSEASAPGEEIEVM